MTKSAERLDGTLALLKKVKEADSDELPELVAALKEHCGGIDGYMKLFMQDFKKARGEGLTPLEEKLYERKESVIQKWHGTIVGLLEAKDKLKAAGNPYQDLSEDDLRSLMLDTAIRCLATDYDLRQAFFNKIIEDNPAIIQEMAGKVTENMHLLRQAELDDSPDVNNSMESAGNAE